MRPSIVTRTFFSFFSLSSSFHARSRFIFSSHYLRHHVPSCTMKRARVLAYATFTRMPFERVRGSWNSMGTCAYGDGRVTCLPSGPCKHETTLGVETPRETIAIFAYFTRLTLYIYTTYVARLSRPSHRTPTSRATSTLVPPCKPWETKRNVWKEYDSLIQVY